MKNQEQIQRLRERYLRALVAGDKESASRSVEDALGGGVPAADIYLNVIVPAQASVGEMWEQGKMSVPEEHLATQISLGLMNHLRDVWERKPLLGKKALVTSAEGDPHTIGSRMVADFFHQDGWDVDYLGGDTPVTELLDFISERKPDVVAISVTLIDYVPALYEFLSGVRKLKDPPKVIAGGLAFTIDPELESSVKADAVAKDPFEATRFARHLCGVQQPQVSLEQILKNIGSRIQLIRKGHGLSQQDLASQAGIDRAYLSSVEHGKQNITLGAMLKLTDALGVSVEDILIASNRD